MCGFAGLISEKIGAIQARHYLQEMGDSIIHRGPDDCGYHQDKSIGLVHRRLAIIDVQNAKQPMADESGDVVIAYNGEVYNYIEIRQELETLGLVFNTQSDTEVVLKAYKTWGMAALSKFNGDFAISIVDYAKERVFLVRDRLGVKPLHYSQNQFGFFFSSESQSLLEPLGVNGTLNKYALVEQLTFGQPIAPNTMINEVSVIEPGHYLELDFSGRIVGQVCYWQLKRKEVNYNDDIAASIRTGLENATKIRLRSDVEVATLLSGGLDSSAITAIAAKQCKQLTSYSIDYVAKDTQESPNLAHIHGSDLDCASVLAKSFNLDHQVIALDKQNLLSNLSPVTNSRMSPVTLGSELTMYELLKNIKGKHKVVLSGDGADELYLGYYMHFDKLKLQSEVDPYFVGPSYKLFPALRKNFFDFNPDQYVRAKVDEILQGSELDKSDPDYPFHAMHYLQLKVVLPYLLDRLDRISMQHSIEVRVPFCDHNLVESFYSLPAAIKYDNVEKKALREAFSDLLPNIIVNRKKSVFPYTRGSKGVSIVRRKMMRRVILNGIAGRRRGISGVFRTGALLSTGIKNRKVSDSFQRHSIGLQMLSLDELLINKISINLKNRPITDSES